MVAIHFFQNIFSRRKSLKTIQKEIQFLIHHQKNKSFLTNITTWYSIYIQLLELYSVHEGMINSLWNIEKMHWKLCFKERYFHLGIKVINYERSAVSVQCAGYNRVHQQDQPLHPSPVPWYQSSAAECLRQGCTRDPNQDNSNHQYFHVKSKPCHAIRW